LEQRLAGGAFCQKKPAKTNKTSSARASGIFADRFQYALKAIKIS
jgi:hypothetical protein